jgi:hypothetical protein
MLIPMHGGSMAHHQSTNAWGLHGPPPIYQCMGAQWPTTNLPMHGGSMAHHQSTNAWGLHGPPPIYQCMGAPWPTTCLSQDMDRHSPEVRTNPIERQKLDSHTNGVCIRHQCAFGKASLIHDNIRHIVMDSTTHMQNDVALHA